MFYTVFINVLAENFLKLLYMEHGNESKEMKSVTRMLKWEMCDTCMGLMYSRDVKITANASCSDII